MTFKIQDIKSALIYGGARPSLFSLQITPPSALGELQGMLAKLPVLARVASLPVSTVAPIEVPYFGRKIKLSGNRTYPEWSITVINDEDFILRKAFQQWLEALNSPHLNMRSRSVDSRPVTYKGTAEVTQYGKSGNPLQIYSFEGIFPSEVAPIEVDWARENEIEEFTVTLQYDLWTTCNPTEI